MSDTKDASPKHSKILMASGLSSKSITDVHVQQNGATIVFEFSYSGGSSFIKVNGFQVETGGTRDFGSGTLVQFG